MFILLFPLLPIFLPPPLPTSFFPDCPLNYRFLLCFFFLLSPYKNLFLLIYFILYFYIFILYFTLFFSCTNFPSFLLCLIFPYWHVCWEQLFAGFMVPIGQLLACTDPIFPHLAFSSTLKMEAAYFSELLEPIEQTTWHHIPEHSNHNNHSHENLKSQINNY
jgi:hypothetical protein